VGSEERLGKGVRRREGKEGEGKGKF